MNDEELKLLLGSDSGRIMIKYLIECLNDKINDYERFTKTIDRLEASY